MLTYPVWLFYLFWLPDYLNRARGFDLKAIGYFAWLPYLAADFGSLGGGLLSSLFAGRGWPTLKARKAAMGMCALLMPVAIPAALAGHWAVALAFISVATFGHQSWSASFITLPADLFPKRVVASAYGLTAMCGILAGAAFNRFVGSVVDQIGYTPLLVMVGFMHLAATAVLMLLVPTDQQVPAPAGTPGAS